MSHKKTRRGFTLTSKNVGIKQSIIPEFISGSSTQAVTQEQQPALKTLNKFQGLSGFITPRGFTLIEVLVVVLIIGVLAAIALPMYNRAVLRSRFNALMPIVKAMNDSNEAYYLEHGSYASNPQDLPVQGLSEYPTGTELELGSNMDYAYVLASNRDARNNYIMYQKHSANYPGEIHCEAVTGDDLAEYICESAGGTQNLGTTLTEGYTTYVLSGTGAGIPLALLGLPTCDKAESMGYTCNISENAQGQTVKQICANSVCRTKTYNEDGSYTSVTCQANSEGVCTSKWQFATYDANGNKLTDRSCSSVDSSGNCTAYSSSGNYNYTYDANGNKLTQRNCSSVDSSGNCTAYASSYNIDYTYDANGNELTRRYCSSFDSSGNCTAYGGGRNYIYDENGNLLTDRSCYRAGSNGNCEMYSNYNNYVYTYDENGNKLTERGCNQFDSSGNCTKYDSSSNVDYTYDASGKQISRTCYKLAADGHCSEYYDSGYVYTYDANGNMTSYASCYRYASDGSCSSFDGGGDYVYDDDGKQIYETTCSGPSVDITTGKCRWISTISPSAN